MASKLSIYRAQVHVPNTCAWCESIQDVNWSCNDCLEVLCDRCKEIHKRAKRTKNDDVVPIKEANMQDEAVLPEVCKTHRGKTCDLYCSDCDIAMYAMCLTEKHKQHTFKNIEEEIVSQKQYMHDQLKILKSKSDHFNDNLSKRHEMNKTVKESVDVIRQTVQTQRQKLKAEIDSIADAVLVELSALVEEEEKSYKQDCKSNEQTIKEIKQLIRDVEQNTEKMSSTSLFELTGRLRTTIPLYDVTKKTVLPRPPHFMPGKLNADQMKSMIGYIHVGKLKTEDVRCEKKEVDSKKVRQISTFRVPQKRQIHSICPIDDTHTWMSVLGSTELVEVNKEGKVTESVKLDFYPWCLTVTNTEELLITRCDVSPLIHKLSKDRQVTRFTDISPLEACGLSVSDSDEVFVTTHTTTVQVLNMSGERIRQIACGGDGRSIVCMTTGDIAVTTGHGQNSCKKMIVINKSDQVIHKWSGELDNGQKLKKTGQCEIARDRYGRVFVPDCDTNQVYVLSGNERRAKCLLDKRHGVTEPMAVCVDRCGHVWIGCNNGTVHVMEL
ncbi:tripartite motif-containing protein 45-like [Mizuhopecten yessoensis]|uniref:tripartite motif-containing protein 45-like n=1 Tax=Mizuhopecten yessoensis TaxID=6573 RepID=UPI000B45B5B1|nr:tripartite motif-containing protein 45-like [Mizuhopecten yessoensis]